MLRLSSNVAYYGGNATEKCDSNGIKAPGDHTSKELSFF